MAQAVSQVVVRVLITDGQELAALGAARSLGRAGYQVTVAYSAAAPPPSAASRYVAEAVRSPDPWQEQPAFRAWLTERARQAPSDGTLPISEAALVAAAALGERLPGVLLCPGAAQRRFTLSKYHATRAAQQAGVAVPPTAFLLPPRQDGEPGEPDEAAPDDELWQRIAELWELGARGPGEPNVEPAPSLLFKTDNHFLPSGSYQKGRVARVGSRAEAMALVREARALGAGLIAQRPIPGHGEGVFLLRHGGRTVLRFVHQRLHEVPYTGGVSSLRRSSHDDALVASAERLLAAIDYSGVAMLEFRRAPDGTAYFLEINGRLWGSVALCLHAGVDFPRALLECALQKDQPPQAPYRDGLRCRNVLPGEIEHLASVLRAPGAEVPLGRKLGALGEFARLSLDPSVRHDHLWLEDPLPALVQAQQTLGDLGQRLGARVRHRLEAAQARPLLRRIVKAQPAQLDRLARATEPRRVLFLCFGNICRSPFAAACLAARAPSSLHIESAGFHPSAGRPTPPRFVGLAQAHGVDLSAHRSRPVTPEELAAASLLVVMDAANLRDLARLAPAALDRTILLGPLAPDGAAEIADPFTQGIGEARRCYEQIVGAVEALHQRLTD